MDQNLTYELEVKHLLNKLACGIKTIYNVKDFFPEKTCLTLPNTFVVSHLHLPAMLLKRISQNLITSLENQLGWGIETCCNRNKHDSSSDLQLKHEIFPIKLLLDYRATYFWKRRNNFIPAFNRLNEWSTAKNKFHERTNEIIFDAYATTNFLQNFHEKSVVLWNNIPESLSKTKNSYETIKTKLKPLHFSN